MELPSHSSSPPPPFLLIRDTMHVGTKRGYYVYLLLPFQGSLNLGEAIVFLSGLGQDVTILSLGTTQRAKYNEPNMKLTSPWQFDDLWRVSTISRRWPIIDLQKVFGWLIKLDLALTPITNNTIQQIYRITYYHLYHDWRRSSHRNRRSHRPAS